MSRVTLTEKQFALFDKRKPRAKGAPRLKKRKEDLPENILEKQCLDFLRVRGWIVDRQQSGLFIPPWDPMRRVRVGEKGCFDWVALNLMGHATSEVNLFYLELKAPGKKLDAHQLAWARLRHVAGFLCVWFSDFDQFVDWYRGRFGE